MVGMILKLVLVLAYFVLVFIITCLIEYLVSVDHPLFTCSSDTLRRLIAGTRPVEVRQKPVTQLKRVLDQRGVSYYNVVEKKDLYNLIGDSGVLTEEELESALTELNASQQSSARPGDHLLIEGLQLNSSAHFNELVEDNKDSVWLLRLNTSPKEKGNLTPAMWQRLVRRFARFGVKSGQLDCMKLKRLCDSRGFTKADLVLALPKGKDRQKDSVDFRVIPRRHGNGPEQISLWIDNVLSERIPQLSSFRQLADKWITKAPNTSTEEKSTAWSFLAASRPPPALDMVVFSRTGVRPLVLSALSVKFTGRVHFWWLDVNSSSSGSSALLADLRRFWPGLDLSVLPAYILFKQDQAYSFGHRAGEFLSFRSLDLFLTWAYPEVNDVLLAGLFIVNTMALFSPCLKQGSFRRRLLSAATALLLYNLGFLVLCLPMIGLFSLQLTSPVVSFLLEALRHLSLTTAAAHLRHLLLSGLLSSSLLAAVFLLFGLGLAKLEHWRTGGVDHDPPSSLLSVFHPSPAGPHPVDLEAGGDRDLLYSLSQTNLNLPADPPAFLGHLLTWTFDTAQSWPPLALPASQCVVCLEALKAGVLLCCLPCGHSFHEACVKTWLLCSRDAGCPSCRWPAYKTKIH